MDDLNGCRWAHGFFVSCRPTLLLLSPVAFSSPRFTSNGIDSPGWRHHPPRCSCGGVEARHELCHSSEAWRRRLARLEECWQGRPSLCHGQCSRMSALANRDLADMFMLIPGCLETPHWRPYDRSEHFSRRIPQRVVRFYSGSIDYRLYFREHR